MEIIQLNLLRWKEIYGFIEYGSILSDSVQKGKRGDRQGSRWIYNFKQYGKSEESIRIAVEAFSAWTGCGDIIAIPGHTNTKTYLQKAFGEKIAREKEVKPRKYNHSKPLPEGFEKTYSIDVKKIHGQKVLLVDDICTSGKTMEHFGNVLSSLGFEVSKLALGLDHKLELKKSGKSLIIAKPETTKRESGDIVFENRLKVLEYLQKQGYKIAKSKLYSDTKNGYLRLQSNGSILLQDVEAYIKNLGLQRFNMDGPDPEEAELLNQQKQKKVIEKLEWENKKRKFEYEREIGRYIPREDLELELASRAGVLDSGLRTKIKTHARDWIRMAGGRADKVPEVIEDIFQVLDGQLNEFARMDRFQVIFDELEE